VEEIEGQNQRTVGATEQWISLGEGGRHVARCHGRSVTEPLKLLPHYHLDPSSGSLRNNTEVTRRLCRVIPGKSLTSQD
jgi:hypothetical protein